MKQITITLILACLLGSTHILSQEKYNSTKKHFVIENLVMLTDTKGNFLSFLNNEISASYGLTSWFSIGVFHDLHKKTFKNTDNMFLKDENLLGIKGSLSILPVLGEGINNKLTRWDICLSVNVSYDRGGYHISQYSDKKDYQNWVNYYRVNVKYYLSPQVFLSGSAGIANTNRFFLGAGIKL